LFLLGEEEEIYVIMPQEKKKPPKILEQVYLQVREAQGGWKLGPPELPQRIAGPDNRQMAFVERAQDVDRRRLATLRLAHGLHETVAIFKLARLFPPSPQVIERFIQHGLLPHACGPG